MKATNAIAIVIVPHTFQPGKYIASNGNNPRHYAVGDSPEDALDKFMFMEIPSFKVYRD